jgi:hypothetical protein
MRDKRVRASHIRVCGALNYSSTMCAFVGRLLRATRIAATDERIPRPLRWGAALGLLPIPGPVDELVLLAVAVPLALFYRGPLAEAWRGVGSADQLSSP